MLLVNLKESANKMKFYKIVYSPNVDEIISELESNFYLDSHSFVFKILNKHIDLFQFCHDVSRLVNLNKFENLLDLTDAINVKILLAIYRANLEFKKHGIKLYYPLSFSVNPASDLFYKFSDSLPKNRSYVSIFEERQVERG
jgi:hypothetical protein